MAVKVGPSHWRKSMDRAFKSRVLRGIFCPKMLT
jgi:hypothetical protein